VLVLSLFPSADLLGLAFEQAGFVIVRGPEVMLGQDIRGWHSLPGKFMGVIGGPPCKSFSRVCKGNTPTQGNLIPEFERVVAESEPDWWVMENVPTAPVPRAARWSAILDAWEFGAGQHRRRRFSSNLFLDPVPVPGDQRCPDPLPCVTAYEHRGCDRRKAGRKLGRRMTLEEVNMAMGLPSDFSTLCLKVEYAYMVRGNGVPLPMGRAIAEAVKVTLGTAASRP
jgi:DNA (cytosine-5)-methyltransferase 1